MKRIALGLVILASIAWVAWAIDDARKNETSLKIEEAKEPPKPGDLIFVPNAKGRVCVEEHEGEPFNFSKKIGKWCVSSPEWIKTFREIHRMEKVDD